MKRRSEQRTSDRCRRWNAVHAAQDTVRGHPAVGAGCGRGRKPGARPQVADRTASPPSPWTGAGAGPWRKPRGPPGKARPALPGRGPVSQGQRVLLCFYSGRARLGARTSAEDTGWGAAQGGRRTLQTGHCPQSTPTGSTVLATRDVS